MSWEDIAIIVVAVLAGSFVKSITGMGLPLVAIPVMSLFVPTETAIVVMAIPNAAQNLVLAVRHRHVRHETNRLALFCGVGMVGALVGTITLGVVSENVTRLALVAVVAVYLVLSVTRPTFRVTDEMARQGTVPVAFLAGLFQGGIGISGPVVATWHHGLRLGRDAFVFSIATVFFLTGATQAAVLGVSGRLDGRLSVSLLLVVLVLTTVPIGGRLRDRISATSFERLVLGLLALSCASIAIDVAAELW